MMNKSVVDTCLLCVQARVAELRAEVVNLRSAAAGGGVAASETRIRELAAQLDETKLCAPTHAAAVQTAAVFTLRNAAVHR